eukprot:g31878.t1
MTYVLPPLPAITTVAGTGVGALPSPEDLTTAQSATASTLRTPSGHPGPDAVGARSFDASPRRLCKHESFRSAFGGSTEARLDAWDVRLGLKTFDVRGRTIAGGATTDEVTDGLDAASRKLFRPMGLALDITRALLYVTDFHLNQLRRIDLSSHILTGGTITSVTGAAVNCEDVLTRVDGAKLDPPISFVNSGGQQCCHPNLRAMSTLDVTPWPQGLALDSGTNMLYVSQGKNHRVVRIHLDDGRCISASESSNDPLVSAEDLRALPHLPGYIYRQRKSNYPRANSWNLVNGVRIEQKEGISFDKPKFVKVSKLPDVWRSGSLPDSETREVFKTDVVELETQELPAWDAFDRHVLRFSGYFKESVVEANLENHRVRKAIIYYYLEDRNGAQSRQQRDATRSADPTTSLPIPGGKNHASTQPRTYEKIYREVMLGGGHINADMQQFLENDKKVLRFYAVMDDAWKLRSHNSGSFDLNIPEIVEDNVVGLDVNHALACFYDTHHMTPGCQGQEFVD